MVLDKAEAFLAKEQGDSVPLLRARLAPDMFPLVQQVRTTADFALRACCPLAGVEPPMFEDNEKTLQDLKERITVTLAFLDALPADEINRAEGRVISTKASFAIRQFNDHDYLLHYTLPNFFFHLTTAYAILRSSDIPLSKRDFDGYHAYDDGFTFPGPP